MGATDSRTGKLGRMAQMIENAAQFGTVPLIENQLPTLGPVRIARALVEGATTPRGGPSGLGCLPVPPTPYTIPASRRGGN
ncbi:hypothetical protein SAMN05216376_111138 [Mameliella alba]|nr:hypothetical protein LX94_03625 [Mameliella alba]GGF73553.1 hypothetical protein GCM10011319_37570 [Mameliella alba]SDD76835.1 hypothetical protein SAMN05216376_111138 [Mameliella alba]